ncbi:MAG: CpsB/CapC family capsule biosynthesis tyrosine phosphatase [Schaedlerella sp.]|nr:CpsB/CapC family capsule biosynthesis tyrosine phosphatase [Schaedlerella sp.]
MIDIHAHILPGIDDGAQDIYDTLEMASIAEKSGVTEIIATPHCNIPGYFDNYFGKAYRETFRWAKEVLRQENIPIKLNPGMEVFATYDLPDLIVDEKVIPLNGSRYILIEFDFQEDPEFAEDLLMRVKAIRAKPVIAHAERYEFVQDNPAIVYEWRKKGYVIQANKSSFQGGFGRHAQHTAYQLLHHNLISVVASDTHSPYKRTPFMIGAYEEVCEEYTKHRADLLFLHNPRNICNNRPILKLEPVPFTGYGIL